MSVAHFPNEIPMPPRRYIERGYNVVRWTEMRKGGHFAAVEEPGALAEDIRLFARQFRQMEVLTRTPGVRLITRTLTGHKRSSKLTA